MLKLLENKFNVVCIILARGGSKSIPRKNLIDFCGKPLLVWSIGQALGSRYIKSVFVSSDSNEILCFAKKAGAGVILRPKQIAGDRASSEDALLHALVEVERRQQEKISIVVFLQATSPLRTPEDIDQAIEVFISKKADSLFSATRLEDFCLWQRNGQQWKSLNFDYRNRGRRQERDPLFLENGSIYIFKPNALRQLGNRLGGKITVYLMPFWKSYEIDEPSDVELCRYFMMNKILNCLKASKTRKVNK